MKEEKKALIPKESIVPKKPKQETTDLSVESFISQAIATKGPIDTLERLFALREKVKAEQAKEAFDKSMAAFQVKCPTIKKKKDVPTGTGKKAYSYAPLEDIVEQVKVLLQEHGFSYSTQTETKENAVKSTCIVKHEFGHSESSSMEVPLGNKTNIMSQTQVVAAALTFAKRYAFCNAFGIMTADEDNEQVFQKENQELEVSPKYEKQLRECKSLEELKEVWANLPNSAKAFLDDAKNDVKKKLT